MLRDIALDTTGSITITGPELKHGTVEIVKAEGASNESFSLVYTAKSEFTADNTQDTFTVQFGNDADNVLQVSANITFDPTKYKDHLQCDSAYSPNVASVLEKSRSDWRKTCDSIFPTADTCGNDYNGDSIGHRCAASKVTNHLSCDAVYTNNTSTLQTAGYQSRDEWRQYCDFVFTPSDPDCGNDYNGNGIGHMCAQPFNVYNGEDYVIQTSVSDKDKVFITSMPKHGTLVFMNEDGFYSGMPQLAVSWLEITDNGGSSSTASMDVGQGSSNQNFSLVYRADTKYTAGNTEDIFSVRLGNDPQNILHFVANISFDLTKFTGAEQCLRAYSDELKIAYRTSYQSKSAWQAQCETLYPPSDASCGYDYNGNSIGDDCDGSKATNYTQCVNGYNYRLKAVGFETREQWQEACAVVFLVEDPQCGYDYDSNGTGDLCDAQNTSDLAKTILDPEAKALAAKVSLANGILCPDGPEGCPLYTTHPQLMQLSSLRYEDKFEDNVNVGSIIGSSLFPFINVDREITLKQSQCLANNASLINCFNGHKLPKSTKRPSAYSRNGYNCASVNPSDPNVRHLCLHTQDESLNKAALLPHDSQFVDGIQNGFAYSLVEIINTPFEEHLPKSGLYCEVRQVSADGVFSDKRVYFDIDYCRSSSPDTLSLWYDLNTALGEYRSQEWEGKLYHLKHIPRTSDLRSSTYVPRPYFSSLGHGRYKGEPVQCNVGRMGKGRTGYNRQHREVDHSQCKPTVYAHVDVWATQHFGDNVTYPYNFEIRPISVLHFGGNHHARSKWVGYHDDMWIVNHCKLVPNAESFKQANLYQIVDWARQFEQANPNASWTALNYSSVYSALLNQPPYNSHTPTTDSFAPMTKSFIGTFYTMDCQFDRKTVAETIASHQRVTTQLGFVRQIIEMGVSTAMLVGAGFGFKGIESLGAKMVTKAITRGSTGLARGMKVAGTTLRGAGSLSNVALEGIQLAGQVHAIWQGTSALAGCSANHREGKRLTPEVTKCQNNALAALAMTAIFLPLDVFGAKAEGASFKKQLEDIAADAKIAKKGSHYTAKAPGAERWVPHAAKHMAEAMKYSKHITESIAPKLARLINSIPRRGSDIHTLIDPHQFNEWFNNAILKPTVSAKEALERPFRYVRSKIENFEYKKWMSQQCRK